MTAGLLGLLGGGSSGSSKVRSDVGDLGAQGHDVCDPLALD